MRSWSTVLASASALFSGGCLCLGPPPEVVKRVDIQRYMGRWYEIARYPNSFQSPDCVATTADYTLRLDGKVRVVNRCRKGGFDGPEQSIEGVARVADPRTSAKLKVSFFPPFEGNYWIIELDPDYRWAVVGEPCRRLLWILSRSPFMDDETYADILARLPAQGYDPDRLMLTPQP
jgi:apolipoprotein D and lipocalin family protein